MPGTSPGKSSAFEWLMTASSQRDVVVLFPRVFEPLAAQHVEGPAQASPRRAGRDDVVDKAAARRDKRVREFLAVFLGARLDRGGVGEIGAKNDLDRALRGHYRDLRRGPRKVYIPAQMLRT